MIRYTELAALEDYPPFQSLQVAHGVSEAGVVRPTPPTGAPILSLKLDAAPVRTMDEAEYLASSSSDGNASSGLDSETGKKTVWGRTSNKANGIASVVMGGSVSWPALTESTRTSTKTCTERLTANPGHVNSPQQKSVKSVRGGNNVHVIGTCSSFSSNGKPSSSTSAAEMSQNIVNHPTKDNYINQDNVRRDSHGWVNQVDRQRRLGDSSRRGYHGNRRDQERGFHDRSPSRALSGRDLHMQRDHPRQRVMQPPMPPMVPFIIPPPFQHFPGPMAFPDFLSQGYYFPIHPHPPAFGGFPFVLPTTIPTIQQPMFSAPTHQHRTSLLKQIEYYFSVENLCKDEYLRKNMDGHGWVSVFLIANFKRVQLLTDNVQFILDVLRSSEVVEVQGNRIRRRYDWSKWILYPHQSQCSHESESPPTATNQPTLVSLMENVALEEKI